MQPFQLTNFVEEVIYKKYEEGYSDFEARYSKTKNSFYIDWCFIKELALPEFSLRIKKEKNEVILIIILEKRQTLQRNNLEDRKKVVKRAIKIDFNWDFLSGLTMKGQSNYIFKKTYFKKSEIRFLSEDVARCHKEIEIVLSDSQTKKYVPILFREYIHKNHYVLEKVQKEAACSLEGYVLHLNAYEKIKIAAQLSAYLVNLNDRISLIHGDFNERNVVIISNHQHADGIILTIDYEHLTDINSTYNITDYFYPQWDKLRTCFGVATKFTDIAGLVHILGGMFFKLHYKYLLHNKNLSIDTLTRMVFRIFETAFHEEEDEENKFFVLMHKEFFSNFYTREVYFAFLEEQKDNLPEELKIKYHVYKFIKEFLQHEQVIYDLYEDYADRVCSKSRKLQKERQRVVFDKIAQNHFKMNDIHEWIVSIITHVESCRKISSNSFKNFPDR